MVDAGITQDGARVPDPGGRNAATRLEAIAMWGPNALGADKRETLRWLESAIGKPSIRRRRFEDRGQGGQEIPQRTPTARGALRWEKR